MSVYLYCLFKGSNSDSHMSGYEDGIQDGIKVKTLSMDQEPSLGGHDIEEASDQMLANTDDLGVGQELKEESDEFNSWFGFSAVPFLRTSPCVITVIVWTKNVLSSHPECFNS